MRIEKADPTLVEQEEAYKQLKELKAKEGRRSNRV